ncbi:amidase [Aureobasidium pullulans]|nr:amidase [Aureobasidium pullulans]
MTWVEVSRRKKESLQTLIPPQWKLSATGDADAATCLDVSSLVLSELSLNERLITGSNVEQILRSISEGEMTSYEVISAFSHRAALAHQLTNCLSEINFESASKRARELDAYWRLHGRTYGPLHGLPISVMDRYSISGLESACGFVSWLGNPKNAEDEGTVVRRMQSLGAIVLCKTNVPMSMMLGETTNNIVGSTVNPFNRNYSAGGACGGEGALIALKGSPLGLATDMAGSTRIPSSFCGLYGMKLSEERLPTDGIESVLPGLPVGAGSVGMISADAKSLQHVLRLLLDSAPWNSCSDVLEIPWRQEKLDAIKKRAYIPEKLNGRLVFALMKDDGHSTPDLPTKQALATVEQSLRLCGHEVVDWKPPSHKTATETLFKIFGSTSGKCIREAIDASGEPPVDQLKEWYNQADTGSLPTEEFWKLCEEMQIYKRSYMEYWLSASAETVSGRPIDGVILPVSPNAATREGTDRYFGYTAVANALDLPSCTFPVTGRGSVLDGDSTEFSVDHAQGLPVGLQVMCWRLQEEKVLALVEAIGQSMDQTYNPGGTHTGEWFNHSQ